MSRLSLEEFVIEFEKKFKEVIPWKELELGNQVGFGLAVIKPEGHIVDNETGWSQKADLFKKWNHLSITTPAFEHKSCAEIQLISELINVIDRLSNKRYKKDRPENLVLFWRSKPEVSTSQNFEEGHIYRGTVRFSMGQGQCN